MKTCPHCNGSGSVMTYDPISQGMYDNYRCPVCRGKGEIHENNIKSRITIAIIIIIIAIVIYFIFK